MWQMPEMMNCFVWWDLRLLNWVCPTFLKTPPVLLFVLVVPCRIRLWQLFWPLRPSGMSGTIGLAAHSSIKWDSRYACLLSVLFLWSFLSFSICQVPHLRSLYPPLRRASRKPRQRSHWGVLGYFQLYSFLCLCWFFVSFFWAQAPLALSVRYPFVIMPALASPDWPSILQKAVQWKASNPLARIDMIPRTRSLHQKMDEAPS